jgi:hypothetical protein
VTREIYVSFPRSTWAGRGNELRATVENLGGLVAREHLATEAPSVQITTTWPLEARLEEIREALTVRFLGIVVMDAGEALREGIEVKACLG